MRATQKNIKSPLRFPEVPRKTVVWCLQSSPHSLTYSRGQKQKLDWCHWFGQFTVRLTRKILPYCAPSLSTSSAGTGPKSNTEFWVLSICPPSCPVSLMESFTCSFHNILHVPLPLLSHSWHPTADITPGSRDCRHRLAPWCSSQCFWQIAMRSIFLPFFKNLQWLLIAFGMKIPRFTFISNKGSDCYPWKYVHHHIRWEWNLTWLTLTGNASSAFWYQQK